MYIKKLTYGGLLIAMAILLPQVFHLTSVPQSGQVFLPMHIPVLMSGFILGPVFGVCIGVISPIFSASITGMPTLARLPFMVLELAAYGFMSGFLYNKVRFHKKNLKVYVSLVGAMIFGRLVYGLCLLIAASLLHIPGVGPVAALTATITGIYGVFIQLLFIPPLIIVLERSGFLERFVTTKSIV